MLKYEEKDKQWERNTYRWAKKEKSFETKEVDPEIEMDQASLTTSKIILLGSSKWDESKGDRAQIRIFL